MKFDEFWQSLGKSCTIPLHLQTLDQNKQFLCQFSVGEVMITPDSTSKGRPVAKEQFQRVWRRACKLLSEEKFKPGAYSDITVNASYIVALIKYVAKQEPIECEPIQTREKRWKVWKAD
jgi:hypothetical protein